MRVLLGRLRKQAGDPAGGSGPALDEAALDETGESGEQPMRIVVCASCGHRITDADARTTVAGRHQHSCVNPGGVAYRIVCYSQAPGCVGVGEWTDYYSWFAGYFWQISCCGRCSMHLGWGFTGDRDLPDFFGLICDRVEERAA